MCYPQDTARTEYQNRFEIMYWVTTPRMVPQVHSLDCVTDGDRHSLDEPCTEAQVHGEVPCMVWGVWGVQAYSWNRKQNSSMNNKASHIFLRGIPQKGIDAWRMESIIKAKKLSQELWQVVPGKSCWVESLWSKRALNLGSVCGFGGGGWKSPTIIDLNLHLSIKGVCGLVWGQEGENLA